MLENALTFDETAATGRTRLPAPLMNAPLVHATGDRGEPQAAVPVGPGDAPSTSRSGRPLRRWSVAELIASARVANGR
jgi:hypothetical protein